MEAWQSHGIAEGRGAMDDRSLSLLAGRGFAAMQPRAAAQEFRKSTSRSGAGSHE